MAEGQALPIPSLVSVDDLEDNPNVKKSERRSVPSDAERQSTAARQATGGREGEDGMKSSPRLDSEEQASHVVEADPPANSTPNPAKLWTRFKTGWSEIADQLAEWFGLNQSKYQWAVDELLERQLGCSVWLEQAGDHQAASKVNVEGLQMQNIQAQTMQRDSKRLSFEG